jgi:hypothetical protein
MVWVQPIVQSRVADDPPVTRDSALVMSAPEQLANAVKTTDPAFATCERRLSAGRARATTFIAP